jgi:hypothetical protein
MMSSSKPRQVARRVEAANPPFIGWHLSLRRILRIKRLIRILVSAEGIHQNTRNPAKSFGVGSCFHIAFASCSVFDGIRLP